MSQSSNNELKLKHFIWKIFQRNGVYYADGRSNKIDLGKSSLGTRDWKAARLNLELLDHKLAVKHRLISEPTSVVATSAITISDGWARYLEYCGRSQIMKGVSTKTLKRYRAVKDKHIKFCLKQGILSWEQFDSTMMEAYAKVIERRLAARTVYFELTLIKSTNKWLTKKKLLGTDFIIDHPLQKPEGTDTYCYSAEELEAMISHCANTPELGWLQETIIGLSHTGMRINELAQLRWSAIDKDWLTVIDERSSKAKKHNNTSRTTKGKRSRKIPLHPRLIKLLASMKRTSDGYVFHAQHGGLLRDRNVLAQFKKHVIEPLKQLFLTPIGEIGFEDGVIHGFRHFFCSQCFLSGRSEGEIQQWLGHRDSKITEHYRHLRMQDAIPRMASVNFLPPETQHRADAGTTLTPVLTTDNHVQGDDEAAQRNG